uniref:Uncharacterized protein n=1 Tax=Acrobeloides nanus TaxID=290746 RepID=A0A914DFK3_9BILA
MSLNKEFIYALATKIVAYDEESNMIAVLWDLFKIKISDGSYSSYDLDIDVSQTDLAQSFQRERMFRRRIKRNHWDEQEH